MATTTNFGWETPDDTDLVKDGALAIRTLGNSIDTSLVDLKGGTTGQVLSKNSNTDMDFTWVTSDDANAIQNAIVDAKGDLIAASAADTPARLAVGNNGETLVADSSTSTGLRWQTPKSVNYLLNSDMSIWQRGTSIAAAASVVYGADRWSFMRNSLGTGATMSRQSSTNTGFQYAMRIQRDSGNTNTEQIIAFQPLESSQSIPLAGKTVTLSFWARAGANFSATSSQMSATLATGTGTDQAPNTWRFGGWTSQTTALNASPIITTSWARYQATATLGSSITQVGVNLGFTPTGTAGANDWVEVTGVQLEIGSIATQFQTATGTLAGERSACERYYCRFDSGSTNYNPISHVGQATATTTSNNTFQFPTTMRIAPTSVDGANLSVYGSGSGTAPAFAAVSAIALTRATVNMAELSSTSTGLTLGGIYRLQPNNAAGYVAFSAEL